MKKFTKKIKIRYPEYELQVKFAEWFQQFGYREVDNDDQTKKASCMDSVGFIGSRPVLIEFKDQINLNGIRHSNDRVGTAIELKINRGLKCLYGDRNESMTKPLSEWNKKTRPHIYVVANQIEEAAQQGLKDFLQVRSLEWKFIYTVYWWNKDQAIKVTEDISNSGLEVGEKPQIPELRPKPQNRSQSRTLEEFREIAKDNQVLELFDIMLLRIQSSRGIATRNVQNLNFRFPRLHSNAKDNMIGIWPTRSSKEKGLLVSYSFSLLEACFNLSPEIEKLLPGRKPPDEDTGHLGGNRYLRTPIEIHKFWDLLTEE